MLVGDAGALSLRARSVACGILRTIFFTILAALDESFELVGPGMEESLAA